MGTFKQHLIEKRRGKDRAINLLILRARFTGQTIDVVYPDGVYRYYPNGGVKKLNNKDGCNHGK